MPTTRTEAVISATGNTMNGAVAVDTMVTAVNQKHENFNLVNSSGQIVAAVIGMVPVLAPITLQANTYAGTVTFLKIIMDKNNGVEVGWGDYLTLAGNISGIVASIAVLAAATGVAATTPVWGTIAVVATGVGIVAGAGGIYFNENFPDVYNKVVDYSRDMFSDWWPTTPVPTSTNDLYLDSNGNHRTWSEINNDPNADFGAIRIESSSWGSPSSIVAIGAPDPNGDGEWQNPE